MIRLLFSSDVDDYLYGRTPRKPRTPVSASDREAIRRSLAAHSDRLEARRAADGSITMQSATVSDLLLTLHRAVEALA